MVAFVPLEDRPEVLEHLGAPPSVVVDYDVANDVAVDGLYTLLGKARALDDPAPEDRRTRPMADLRPSVPRD
jgi:hypothetical protein